VVLAFGAIHDPAKKLNFLKFAYQKLHHLASEEKLKMVKTTLELFPKYVRHEIPSSNSNSSQVQPSYGGGLKLCHPRIK